MDEEKAVQGLKDVKEVFDKVGIKFWLKDGTLLGAIRDRKVIEWDTDIDMGAWYKEVDKIVSTFPELKKRGFNVFFPYKPNQNSMLEISRPGCVIGVSLYRVSGGYAWVISPHGDNPLTGRITKNLMHMLSQRIFSTKPDGKFKILKFLISLLPFKRYFYEIVWTIWEKTSGKYEAGIYPKQFFEKLRTINFYGMKFNVPSETEKYLEYVYGPDWKTPKKEWNYTVDDGSYIYPVRIEDLLKGKKSLKRLVKVNA